jgi:hypothetical protein
MDVWGSGVVSFSNIVIPLMFFFCFTMRSFGAPRFDAPQPRQRITTPEPFFSGTIIEPHLSQNSIEDCGFFGALFFIFDFFFTESP